MCRFLYFSLTHSKCVTVCIFRFGPVLYYFCSLVCIKLWGCLKRGLVTCMSYIRRWPCPFIWLTPSSTDPQTWLTQTLSVCESSLLIAGQWVCLAFWIVLVFTPSTRCKDSEFLLLFFFSVLKGDPLSHQTRSSAVCHDRRHAEQGKAWYCLTARGWRNFLTWIPFQHVLITFS